jgi:hypothetical protein
MPSLKFRPVSKPNGEFSDWLHNYRNLSGCYVIRSSGAIAYVGESHSGALTKTLKRHFWTWNDKPDFVHHVYQRGRCDIAVITCPPSAAVSCQNNLIARLKPRDNRQGN